MRATWGFLVAGLALAGQPQQVDVPIIKVDVDIVNVLCSVRDNKGALVSTLGKDDFGVAEDGKEQVIRYFARETELPLTLGLLVDVSGSQKNLIEIEKRAAEQFFAKVIRPKDLAFLISFGSDAELLQDSTSSQALLRRGLDNLRLMAGVGSSMPGPVPTISQPRGTVLYDAVYLAAHEKLREEVGRKAIVLITDGVDIGSRLKLADAIEAAQKADTIIYSIYYADPGAYGGGFGLGSRMGSSDLRRMSEDTGGRLFEVGRRDTLDSIFQRIQEEMRSQYAIGYVSSKPERDGGFRRIEVKTSQRGLKVQARRGYYAIKPGE
jgi:VWFA-related protein